MSTKIAACDIPCHAMAVDDYNYSTDWGNKLIDIWIKTKKLFRSEPMSVKGFREELRAAIIEELDLADAFHEGCAVIGIDGNAEFDLYEEYVDHYSEDALSLITSGLHAELCWIPGWNEADLDDLHYDFGLRSDHFKSNYIEDVQPGKWLEVFLKMVNCSSTDLIGECIKQRGNEGRFFAEKCARAQFKVEKDQNRYQLLTADQVIAAIENAYTGAVPMLHCHVNVRALFEMDPTQAMRLSTKQGKVHVGFHEGIFSGAGYMDTYPGEIVVPAAATGFIGASRMRYDVNETYGLYLPAFYTTPVAVNGK